MKTFEKILLFVLSVSTALLILAIPFQKIFDNDPTMGGFFTAAIIIYIVMPIFIVSWLLTLISLVYDWGRAEKSKVKIKFVFVILILLVVILLINYLFGSLKSFISIYIPLAETQQSFMIDGVPFNPN